MTVFFTADQHFGHRRILELEGRPFDDVAAMDAALVERWNAVVGPDDVVHVLGDVALGEIDDSLALVAQLNGTKHLVAGNHDRCFALARGGRGRTAQEWLATYLDAGFATATDGLETQELVTASGRTVLLSHFPTTLDAAALEAAGRRPDRYGRARPHPLPGQVLVHGHVHSSWVHRWSPTVDRVLEVNVGVDVRGFAPVSEADLEAEIEAALRAAPA